MAPIRPVPRWMLPSFLALSTLAHLAFWLVLLADLVPPQIDLELQLPAEVEFGLTESVEAVPSAAPPPVEPPSADDGQDEDEASAEQAQAEAEAEAERKRRREQRRRERERKRREAEARARREAEARADGEEGDVGSELPPGAQIAVRLDMERIRESPIAEDVRGLLAAIPDWKALLDGSGIDPLESLDRLLLATPNLQRSRIVVAGRYRGKRAQVDEAVEKLAAAKGVEASWELRDGVPVAPWANVDATPRVIALIGPQHFSISREEDLPRLLAIAAARKHEADLRRREQKRRGEGSEEDDPAEDPAEELLSMPKQAGLSFEVEGVRRFVRRGHGIPAKLRIHALETEDTTLRLVGRWVYDDPEQALAAQKYWDAVRTRYASNTLVAILGLAGPLREGKIEAMENELHLEAELSVRQTRLILGYVREMVAPPPAPVSAPPSGASQPGSSQPATGVAP